MTYSINPLRNSLRSSALTPRDHFLKGIPVTNAKVRVATRELNFQVEDVNRKLNNCMEYGYTEGSLVLLKDAIDNLKIDSDLHNLVSNQDLLKFQLQKNLLSEWVNGKLDHRSNESPTFLIQRLKVIENLHLTGMESTFLDILNRALRAENVETIDMLLATIPENSDVKNRLMRWIDQTVIEGNSERENIRNLILQKWPEPAISSIPIAETSQPVSSVVIPPLDLRTSLHSLSSTSLSSRVNLLDALKNHQEVSENAHDNRDVIIDQLTKSRSSHLRKLQLEFPELMKVITIEQLTSLIQDALHKNGNPLNRKVYDYIKVRCNLQGAELENVKNRISNASLHLDSQFIIEFIKNDQFTFFRAQKNFWDNLRGLINEKAENEPSTWNAIANLIVTEPFLSKFKSSRKDTPAHIIARKPFPLPHLWHSLIPYLYSVGQNGETILKHALKEKKAPLVDYIIEQMRNEPYHKVSRLINSTLWKCSLKERNAKSRNNMELLFSLLRLMANSEVERVPSNYRMAAMSLDLGIGELKRIAPQMVKNELNISNTNELQSWEASELSLQLGSRFGVQISADTIRQIQQNGIDAYKRFLKTIMNDKEHHIPKRDAAWHHAPAKFINEILKTLPLNVHEREMLEKVRDQGIFCSNMYKDYIHGMLSIARKNNNQISPELEAVAETAWELYRNKMEELYQQGSPLGIVVPAGWAEHSVMAEFRRIEDSHDGQKQYIAGIANAGYGVRSRHVQKEIEGEERSQNVNFYLIKGEDECKRLLTETMIQPQIPTNKKEADKESKDKLYNRFENSCTQIFDFRLPWRYLQVRAGNCLVRSYHELWINQLVRNGYGYLANILQSFIETSCHWYPNDLNNVPLNEGLKLLGSKPQVEPMIMGGLSASLTVRNNAGNQTSEKQYIIPLFYLDDEKQEKQSCFLGRNGDVKIRNVANLAPHHVRFYLNEDGEMCLNLIADEKKKHVYLIRDGNKSRVKNDNDGLILLPGDVLAFGKATVNGHSLEVTIHANNVLNQMQPIHSSSSSSVSESPWSSSNETGSSSE